MADEKLRRLFILMEALWEAREELSKRFEQMDREDLDWYRRERFDEALEENRRDLCRRQALLLHDAYLGRSVAVKCTREEHEAALRLAFGILEGKLLPERVVERVWSESFLQDRRSEG